jgi:PAS domain S-box-containing protein
MESWPEMNDRSMDLRVFREAVESTGHAIYWTDTTGRIEYVNPAFEEQTGYAAEEAIGSNAHILQSGVHDTQFYDRLWETILNGDVWEGQIINERKNGERYVVKQTISPVTGDSGEIVRFVAVNEDITDLRESQESLEQERNRFVSLLNAVPVPLVITAFDDDALTVEQANRAFRDTFGFTDSQLSEGSLDELIVDEGTSAQAQKINEQVQCGERIRREVIRHTADGTERTFLLTATPFGSEPHEESLATYLDITDRKQAEEELKQRTEELEDFANVVSHDLRNPLNVASGHLDLLDSAVESAHIDAVRNAHERMQELIENILMLARHGKTIDDTESVALDDCVSESWATVETADATLNVETTKPIVADESRLHQVFTNLIRNAIEHGGEDVTISVGGFDEGFYVADDGAGIPEAEREQVFEASHTSTETGTGLGLAIVREVVEAHGWEITVTESRTGGARFEIEGVKGSNKK